MSNAVKNLWIVALLIAAGAGLFVLSMGSSPKEEQSSLPEVFSQTPAVSAEGAGIKDPVVSPAIVTSPTGGQEKDFAVQVYSFQSPKRAEAALADLKAKGHTAAFLEVSDLGEKGTWYRVRIGRLKNEEEAQALLEKVRREYNSGIIIKPKQ